MDLEKSNCIVFELKLLIISGVVSYISSSNISAALASSREVKTFAKSSKVPRSLQKE